MSGMKIKYRANHNTWFSDKIEVIHIERETDKTMWIKDNSGRITQNRKDVSDCRYFDTFEESKKYLIDRQKSKIESLKENLEKEAKELFEIQKIGEIEK